MGEGWVVQRSYPSRSKSSIGGRKVFVEGPVFSDRADAEKLARRWDAEYEAHKTLGVTGIFGWYKGTEHRVAKVAWDE